MYRPSTIRESQQAAAATRAKANTHVVSAPGVVSGVGLIEEIADTLRHILTVCHRKHPQALAAQIVAAQTHLKNTAAAAAAKAHASLAAYPAAPEDAGLKMAADMDAKSAAAASAGASGPLYPSDLTKTVDEEKVVLREMVRLLAVELPSASTAVRSMVRRCLGTWPCFYFRLSLPPQT
jgi:hypothetical protein